MRGVTPDERASAGLAAGSLFALEVADAFAANAADALYLARRGAAGLGAQLAASSVLLAVTLGLVGLAVDRARREDRGRLLGRMAVGAAVVLAACRVGLALAPVLAPAGLLVVTKQLSAALELGFWILVADRFDARQSRRLVPLLLTAGGAGSVVGSLATRAVVAAVPVEDLLLAAALACLAAAWLARAIVPRTAGGAPNVAAALAPGPGFATSLSLGARATARSELARRLVVVVAAAGAFAPILYTALGAEAAATYGREADLAGFYGRFRAIVNLVTLLAQAALAPALLRRLGVGVAFLVAPVVGLVLSAGLAVDARLAVAAVAQAGARLVDAAVQTPAEKLAQNLLPRALRGRIGGFLDGIAKRGGALAGGLIATLAVAPRLLGLAAAAVAALWAVAAFALARRYPEFAVEGLARAPAADGPALDETTARALAAQLAGPDDARRALAIEVVRRAPAARSVPLLVDAAHAVTAPAARGRLVMALDHVLEIEVPAQPALAKRVYALLSLSSEPIERASIVQAYARLAPSGVDDGLAPLAEGDESPAVRLAAACALRRRSGAPVDELVVDALALSDAARDAAALALLGGGRLDLARRAVAIEELRAEALAVAAGRVAFRPEPAAALARLSRSGDDAERLLAFGALAEAAKGARTPILAAAGDVLDDPHAEAPLRAAAYAALAALDDATLAPLFARGLADAADDVRDACAAALGRLVRGAPRGSAERGAQRSGAPSNALPVLLVTARFGGRTARDAALEVLRDVETRPADCDDLIEAELAEAAATSARRRGLAGLAAPAGRLLRDRLDERLGEIRRTLALLVELRVGDRRIGRAAAGLGGDARVRGRALEALDALLPRALAARVLPVLEDLPPDEDPISTAEALRGELQGRDGLARVLAVHALGPAERAELRDVIRAAAVAGAEEVDPFRLIARLKEEDDVPRSVETMLLLHNLELFAELTPSQLAGLAAACQWETLGPGDTLEPDGLVVVAAGRLGDHGPGASLGAGSLFGDPAPAPLVAAEKTRILRLGRGHFERAAEDNPRIVLGICRALHRAFAT